MNELLFKQIAKKDLDNLNTLINKGWYETSDFEKAVLDLSNTLSMLQEAIYESRTQGERLQETKLAKGA